jgi:hypothetical protein
MFDPEARDLSRSQHQGRDAADSAVSDDRGRRSGRNNLGSSGLNIAELPLRKGEMPDEFDAHARRGFDSAS